MQLAPDFEGFLASTQAQRDHLLELVFSQAPLGLCVLSPDGRCLAANALVKQLLGRDEAELIGSHIASWFADAQNAVLQALLQDGSTQVDLLLAEGKSSAAARWVHAQCVPLRDAHDGGQLQLIFFKDATQSYLADDALRESEFVFRSQFEHGNIGMALTTPDKGWKRANTKLCEMLGYAEPELIQMDWAELTHPDDLARDVAQFERLLAGEIAGYEMDKRFIHKDGKIVHTHLTVSAYRRVPGPYEYVIASLQDITQAKLDEGALRLAACVFASSQDAILIFDDQLRVIDANPAFMSITLNLHTESVGRAINALLLDGKQFELQQTIKNELQERGHWHGEARCRRADDSSFPARMSIDRVLHEAGEPLRYACVFSDISESHAHQRELYRIARYDMLTGVPNRRLLGERLDSVLQDTRASGQKLALCYIDLDGFKPINDGYGHAVGDLVLAEVAQRLLQHLRGESGDVRRPADMVARLGGDEFVLLLGGLASIQECQQTVQRLLDLISRPQAVDGMPLQISASIGVTLFPDDDADGDTLLRHADQAMYQAKSAGKGRYHIFDIGRERQLSDRRVAINLLGLGLQRGELMLYYQPKVDMRRGEMVGVEALLRWQHPERGLCLPASFLHQTEDSDLDIQIGHFVITQALAQANTWAALGSRLPVNINVSAKLLQSHDFVEFLNLSLQRCPALCPADIVLEVVETTAVADIDRVISILQQCRRIGVRFALDDFGTGYSSLSLLQRMPVQEIKIDQSFVLNILNDRNNLAITQGIIALGKAFNCELVAEGVATVAQGKLLLELGCDQAQGFSMSPALPPQDVLPWYANWRQPADWAAFKH